MKAARQTTGNPASARQYNALRADAVGGGNLLAHNMLGILKLPTNASNGNTITGTVNGTLITITLVSGTPTNPNDVKIGATGTATVANLLAFLQNPSATNTTQVAASAGNQQLLSYVGVTSKDANLIFYSNNNDIDAPLTTFSAATNISGGTYEASTLKLFIEPGLFYIGTTQVNFSGSPTGTFTAPSANPRIDILTIGTPGTITITAGTEAASPVAPSYPTNQVVVAEVYNRVGQTEIRDGDNTATAHGYIIKDARPFNTRIYIDDNAQIAAGVILQSNLGNAGTVPTGTIIPTALPTGTTIAGWLECNGTAISRTTYATLFGAVGTAFGVGDGSTTFNLPDLRGRIPLGSGQGQGTRTGTAVGTGTPTGTPLGNFNRGEWGGEEAHKLASGELPPHTHNYSPANQAGGGASNSTGGPVGGIAATTDGGFANTPAAVMQPFLVLTFYIKT